MKDNDLRTIIKEEFNKENDELLAGEGFIKISTSLPKKNQMKINLKLAFVVVVLIAIGVFIPNLFKTNPNVDDNLDLIDLNINHANLSYVVYKAAKTTLNNNSFKPVSYHNYQTLSFERVEYPFDFIKITNPYRFEVEIPENSGTYIEEQVGFGVIEVIVTEIDFLSQSGNGVVSYYPHEMMIIFKGAYGVYSCLVNGGSGNVSSGNYVRQFSTHKTVQNDNIVKEKKLESIKINVHIVNNNPTSISFENWDNANYAQTRHNTIANTFKRVKASEIYRIIEIEEPELITVNVSIDFIAKTVVYLYPNEDFNLLTFKIDENTEIFFEDGTKASIEDVGRGFVMLSYRKYFEDYNPTHVIAEKLIILDESGIDDDNN